MRNIHRPHHLSSVAPSGQAKLITDEGSNPSPMVVDGDEIKDYISSHLRYYGLDPITFEYMGPSKDEKTWFKIQADGPEKGNINLNAAWLYSAGIHDWYWEDRAPDRMVWRTNLYFKNEHDLLWFMLGR